jgi:ribonuclease Z
MRLADLGVQPFELTALMLTHVHSDHVEGVADVAMTRWIQNGFAQAGPLTIVAPAGAPVRFVQRMFEPFEDDIAVRVHHLQDEPPSVDLRSFVAGSEPAEVWRSDDGTVRVSAVLVHHEPVEPAVAYRIETPDGAVVVSGDTRVCKEVESLATGAGVLVHEACRSAALALAFAGTMIEKVTSYHADTVSLGSMAERAGVGHLMLTHLMPQPFGADDEVAFEADVRRGGYSGPLTVGRDLASVTLGGAS